MNALPHLNYHLDAKLSFYIKDSDAPVERPNQGEMFTISIEFTNIGQNDFPATSLGKGVWVEPNQTGSLGSYFEISSIPLLQPGKSGIVKSEPIYTYFSGNCQLQLHINILGYIVVVDTRAPIDYNYLQTNNNMVNVGFYINDQDLVARLETNRNLSNLIMGALGITFFAFLISWVSIYRENESREELISRIEALNKSVIQNNQYLSRLSGLKKTDHKKSNSVKK